MSAVAVRGSVCPDSAACLNERAATWGAMPRSRGPYHGNASTPPTSPASRAVTSARRVRIRARTSASTGKTYAANGGFVSIPSPRTTPKASDQERRSKASVRSRSAMARATIDASGRSSWNRSDEKMVKGALPNTSAATTPSAPPATWRPSTYAAAIPRPRNARSTAWAAATSDGQSRYASPAAQGTSGG